MGFKYIGACWKKEEKDYLTGVINEDVKDGTRFFIFVNKNKKGDTSPDYSIAVGDDDDGYTPSKSDVPF